MANPRIQATYCGSEDSTEYLPGQTYTFQLDNNQVLREDPDGLKNVGALASFDANWKDVVWLETMEVIE